MAKNITPQRDARPYYLDVKTNKTIYVWNFNYPTIITQDTINKAYKDWYHNMDGKVGKYDRAYYNNKLKEGDGKPGSDCSGMHYGLSGYDKTAQGYYNEAPDKKKGTIDSLPIHNLVILYRGESSSKITHTGIYLGDGTTIHMANSKDNCVYESTDKGKWKWWSYANFIDYSKPLDVKPVITRDLKVNCKGIDVKLLQERLNELKYDCGKVDGVFGKNTKAAVIKFQKAKNITADGIVGKNTAKKLDFIWRGPY